MWKSGKYFLTCFLSLLLNISGFTQNCNYSASIYLEELKTGKPIADANVFVKELQAWNFTDKSGFSRIKAICAGGYHLVISHIGCETYELYIHISGDTTLNITLDHNSQILHEVNVVGKGRISSTQDLQALNYESITQNSNENLATMLEEIAGISTIKNGSGISKPVIHGLYGNRISILNNGITQSGQQWGADHSPEIDPLVANSISIIKGVGALEYLGSSLGSVILVEPRRIEPEPHLHGKGRYFFQSNGLGNGINLELQKNSKAIAWRAIGTFKRSGDNKTPDYYLRNTGSREANFALQLEKSWTEKLYSDLYISSFNAKLGILRGSHIGNITDLEEALERQVPFFTEDKFYYSIDAPSQKVNHHLLKLHSKYTVSDRHNFDLTYAGQYNLRKEFDVRRSGRSNIPALSLKQISNFLELKYNHTPSEVWKIKSGVQVNIVDNTNLPETGILPLIPDYNSQEYGLFGIACRRSEKTNLEFGVRYDFEHRNVAAISTSLPREIIRYINNYHNISAMGGVKHKFNELLEVAYNIGCATRNPEVNELYSNGLHQGVSGIEEGDPELDKETSLKNTLSVKGNIKSKLFFEGLFYYQRIQNYIYLKPQNEIRLTIRGAFPLFKYEKTNAQISGFDLTATYRISEQLNLTGKYSYIKGSDISNDIALINMPSNNIDGVISYQLPKVGKFQNLDFQISNKFVFKQKNLLTSQDFVSPPEAYNLLGLRASAERQLQKLRLAVSIRAENLLNTTYREYLNRQRYFADELGFNLILGINILF